MLIVLIHNDGTGSQHDANYDVEVRVNETTIWRGRVEGHDRDHDWPALVHRVADIGESARTHAGLMAGQYQQKPQGEQT